jgi:hypothetical protein
MTEQVGPAHCRILAAMGPVNSSMASLATVDSSPGPVTGVASIKMRLLSPVLLVTGSERGEVPATAEGAGSPAVGVG